MVGWSHFPPYVEFIDLLVIFARIRVFVTMVRQNSCENAPSSHQT